MAKTWTCARCGQVNVEEHVHCTGCGAPKETTDRSIWTCARCGGGDLSGAWGYCIYCGAKKGEQAIQKPQEHSLTVEVTSEDGAPLSGCEVELHDVAGKLVTRGVTDRSGKYGVRVPEEKYYATATFAERSHRSSVISVDSDRVASIQIPTKLKTEIEVLRGLEVLADKVKVSVKVANRSAQTITDVLAVLTDVPEALDLTKPTDYSIKIGNVKRGEASAAHWWLKPRRCVDGLIKGKVFYYDPRGNEHDQSIEPLQVRNVCPHFTDEGVNENEFIAKLRAGGLPARRTCFSFRGNPKAVFHIAENRVRHLRELPDRDERLEGELFIGHACYLGRAKYKDYLFATVIDVTGKQVPPEGALTLWVYTDEPAAITGYFNETLDFLGQDVKSHIHIVEEKILKADNSCAWCGGLLDLHRVSSHGYAKCGHCDRSNYVPEWLRALT